MASVTVREQINMVVHEVVVLKAGWWEYDGYLSCFLDYMFGILHNKQGTEDKYFMILFIWGI